MSTQPVTVALDQALLAYARAKRRVDRWGEPLRGEAFERNTQKWRRALVDLDRAAIAFRNARIRAYLASRKARAKQELKP